MSDVLRSWHLEKMDAIGFFVLDLETYSKEHLKIEIYSSDLRSIASEIDRALIENHRPGVPVAVCGGK